MRYIIGAALVCGLMVSGQHAAHALTLRQFYCGNGRVDAVFLGEQCDGANLAGRSCESVGFDGGTLACDATCRLDTSGCTVCGNGALDTGEDCDLGNLAGQDCQAFGFDGGTLACSATCRFDLGACTGERVGFPASGSLYQAIADKNDGIAGLVAVPADGTIKAGAPLFYTDNGDGTITDNNTGLMWEKKSGDGGLHERTYLYRWNGDGSQETIWDWLDDINTEGGTGFAGYSDWRIPNVRELQSIVDYGRSGPTIDPAFNTACIGGCTVTTCSCTVPLTYWTGTAIPGPGFAWVVDFELGIVGARDRTTAHYVRAVRAGIE